VAIALSASSPRTFIIAVLLVTCVFVAQAPFVGSKGFRIGFSIAAASILGVSALIILVFPTALNLSGLTCKVACKNDPPMTKVTIVDPAPDQSGPRNGCLSLGFQVENLPSAKSIIVANKQEGVNTYYFQADTDQYASNLWRARMWLGRQGSGMNDKFSIHIYSVDKRWVEYLVSQMRAANVTSWSSGDPPPDAQQVAETVVTRDGNPKLDPACTK